MEIKVESAPPQAEMKPSEILAGAIELLAGGANWIKEELWNGSNGYCLLGAVSKSYYGERFNAKSYYTDIDNFYPKTSEDAVLNKVNDLIKQVTGGLEGHEVNDAEETEFEDVKQVLCDATKLALEQEKLEEEQQS